MNLEQMRDATRRRLGVPSSDNYFTDPTLNDLINEAVQAVSLEANWPWLRESVTFVTVSGTDTYVPPEDWSRTESLTIDGSDPMSWRPLAELRTIPSTNRSEPTIWSSESDILILAHTPDRVYTVQHDYVRFEHPLTVDTDAPFIPAQFHWVVISYAVHVGALRAGRMDAADRAATDYRNWLTRMMSHKRRSTAPGRVRVRPGSGLDIF